MIETTVSAHPASNGGIMNILLMSTPFKIIGSVIGPI